MAACVTGLFPAVAGEHSVVRMCGAFDVTLRRTLVVPVFSRCGGSCSEHLCTGPRVRESRFCGLSAEKCSDGLREEVRFLQFIFNGTDRGIPMVERKCFNVFRQVILKDYLKSLPRPTPPP